MERKWTLDEARAALPGVATLVASAQDAVRQDGFRDGLAGGDPLLIVSGVSDLLAVDGVVLRDVHRGLVDFPAVSADGRPYWLCWVAGEEQLAWWHWPEDGFAGRRPITEAPD